MATWLRHCLPGTIPRRILWGQLAALMALSAALLAVDKGRPCARSGGAVQCNQSSYTWVFRVRAIQSLLVYLPFTVLALWRFYCLTLRPVTLLHSKLDHWTMASSRDLFLECARVIRSSQNLTLLLLTIFTLVLTTIDLAFRWRVRQFARYSYAPLSCGMMGG